MPVTQSRVTRVSQTQAGCTDEGFVVLCQRDADLLGMLDQALRIRKGRIAVAGASLALVFNSLIVTAQQCAERPSCPIAFARGALDTREVHPAARPGAAATLPRSPAAGACGEPGEKKGRWRPHPRVGALPFGGAGRSRGRAQESTTWALLGAGPGYRRPGHNHPRTALVALSSPGRRRARPGPAQEVTPPRAHLTHLGGRRWRRCAAHRGAGRAGDCRGAAGWRGRAAPRGPWGCWKLSRRASSAAGRRSARGGSGRCTRCDTSTGRPGSPSSVRPASMWMRSKGRRGPPGWGRQGGSQPAGGRAALAAGALLSSRPGPRSRPPASRRCVRGARLRGV